MKTVTSIRERLSKGDEIKPAIQRADGPVVEGRMHRDNTHIVLRIPAELKMSDLQEGPNSLYASVVISPNPDKPTTVLVEDDATQRKYRIPVGKLALRIPLQWRDHELVTVEVLEADRLLAKAA